jgi:hydroxymethylpyrimidine pyrophosphatase-like HAD family hydrolase
VNKATGVAMHMERNGWKAEETAAVGDSLSDAQMASAVGQTFLVGGGDPALAEDQPDNLTILGEPAGDGFAHAIEHLGIN